MANQSDALLHTEKCCSTIQQIRYVCAKTNLMFASDSPTYLFRTSEQINILINAHYRLKVCNQSYECGCCMYTWPIDNLGFPCLKHFSNLSCHESFSSTCNVNKKQIGDCEVR